MRGAREALEPLFGTPTDFRFAWAFIDMMKTDNAESAAAAAGRVADARLSAFHDAGRCLGRAMARRLGCSITSRGTRYFIYRPGRRWVESRCRPDFWCTPASGPRGLGSGLPRRRSVPQNWTYALAEKSEADPAHFATGAALRTAIADAIARSSFVEAAE